MSRRGATTPAGGTAASERGLSGRAWAETATRACDLAGALLFGLGLGIALLHWRGPMTVYDEGIVLADAWLVGQGALPYRDFYANYPPGVSLLVAGAWSVLGESILVARALGIALHVLIALAAGRLAGRAQGRAFSALAAGGALTYWSLVPVYPFAWSAALAFALLGLAALEHALTRGTRGAWVAAGLLLGAVGCFRHDLLGFLAIALLALAPLRRRLFPGSAAPRWGVLVASAAAPLVLVWGWVLLQAGWRAPYEDLVYAQASGVYPERALPLPPLWPPSFPAAVVVLTLGGPALAALAWWRGLRVPAALLLGIALLAALPQALGRSDLGHLLDAAVPSLALAIALCERELGAAGAAPARTLLGGALAGLALLPVPELSWAREEPPHAPFDWERAQGLSVRGLPRASARIRLLPFLARNSRPDQPIWVGTARHDAIEANELDLYYLAERRGGARVLQLDPGHADRDDVQRGIIADLRASGTALVVLCRCCSAAPGAPPTGGGSRLLDEHFAREWRPVAAFGDYRVLAPAEPR